VRSFLTVTAKQAVGLFFLILSGSVVNAQAITVAKMRTDIESRVCYPNIPDQRDIDYSDRCTKVHDNLCGSADYCWNYDKDCQAKVDEDNKVIKAYNNHLAVCRREHPSSSFGAASSKSGSGESRQPETPQQSTHGGTDYDAAARAEARLQFELAEKMDTREGWQAFLKDHPDGVYAAYAKKRISELEGGNQPAKAPDPKPSQIERNSRASVSPRIAPRFSPQSMIFSVIVHSDSQIETTAGGNVKRWTSSRNDNWEMPITIRDDVVVLTEGADIYRCGLNSPIQGSFARDGGQMNFTYNCSYSRDGDVYSLNVSYEGIQRPALGNGHMERNATLRFSVSPDKCSFLDGGGTLVGSGGGWYTGRKDRQTFSVSSQGRCRFN
jgi:hypothetical protein